MTAPLVRRRQVLAGTASQDAGASIREPNVPFLKGLEWSPSFAAFLGYIFAIVTYQLRIGTACMTIALLMLPLEKRGLRFPRPLLWTIALVAWAALGWTTTAYPDVVYDSMIELAKVCGVMLVAMNVLTTQARLRFFLVVFLGFFALYPARGTLITYFFAGGGIDGRAAWNFAYSNPNDLAGMCLLVTSLAAGVLVTDRTRWIRFCALAGTVLMPFVILLTESRGAFIALLACAAFALRSYWRKWKKLGLAAVVLAVAVYATPDAVWERMGTLKQVASQDEGVKIDDDGSARQRLELWKVARTIMLENPVTGVGVGAYGRTHYLYAQRPVFDPTAMGEKDAHSTYLAVGAQMGIPGLLIFLTIILSTVVYAERTRRRVLATNPRGSLQLQYMLLGLLGFLVAGIWGSYGFLVLTYLHLSLIYARTHILEAEVLPAAAERESQPSRVRGRVAARAVPGTAR